MISDQLEQQIYQCLDSKMSDAEKQALFFELKNNPEAMKLYCLSASLDANLNRIAHGQLSLNTASENFADLASKSQKRKSFKIAILAAAAVVVIGLITMQLFMVKEQPPTITFATSPGTQFELSHSTTKDVPEGMTLEKGSRLQLSQGTVELTFASGVRSIIMAPADITLHKDDTLFMNRGTAWFQVPQQATGFTVKTKDLDIIDLGTEFGVLAKPNAHDEVHVFKGSVQVTAKRIRKESATLTAKQARRIDPIGRLTIIPSSPTTFLTILPKAHYRYLHWTFDKQIDNAFPAKGSAPGIEHAAASPRNPGTRAHNLLTKGKFDNAAAIHTFPQELLTRHPGISGNKPLTVSCWVKLKRPPLSPRHRRSIVGWGHRGGTLNNNRRWQIGLTGNGDNGSILCIVGAGGHLGTTPLNDNIWHHIAVVWNPDPSSPRGGTLTTYIDGQQEPMALQHPATAPDILTGHPNAPVSIGATLVAGRPTVNLPTLKGFIDELYIINAAFSHQKILHLMETNLIE